MKLLLPVDLGSLLITFLYLGGSILSPSHKFFFVVSFIYFITLTCWTKSVQKAIIYAFFPFWLFNVGRTIDAIVVPEEAINSTLYWGGRKIVFEFSPFFILGLTSIVVMIFHFIGRKVKFRIPSYALCLLTAYLFHTLSAILSPQLADFSFLFTLREFFFLIWFLLSIFVIRNVSKTEKDKIFVTLMLIFWGLLLTEGIVTLLQVINRSTLGLSIEKVESIPSFGYGADENSLQFRPVGLNYHANALANWHVSLLPSIVMLWFRVKSTLAKKLSDCVITSTVVLSLLLIALTLSRSAYLSLFLTLMIFMIFNREALTKAIKLLDGNLRNYKIIILIIIAYLSLIIPDRLLNSIYSFNESGGYYTRQQQLTEAKELFYSHPLLGAGTGMFIPASFELNPKGVMSYFPENVHNGFVLFLAERGILAAFIYLIWLSLLMKKIKKSHFSKTLKLLMLGGIVGNYVMMLYQPFINILSLNFLTTGVLLEGDEDDEKVVERI